MSDSGKHQIGRVCRYARQQCTLADGCAITDGGVFGADVLKLERDALDCDKAGAFLFADELHGRELRQGANIIEKRANARLSRRAALDRQAAERDATRAPLAKGSRMH